MLDWTVLRLGHSNARTRKGASRKQRLHSTSSKMERGKYKDEEVKKKRTVWEKGVSNEDLRTFLAENKPSRPSGKESQSDDGWIWIVAHKETTAESALQEITKEGKQILDELLTRYTEIEENEKIPKVKTKTSGPSKKMLREAAANDCQTRLRSLGTRYPKGKWLFFERKDFVDRVFEKLAQSIIDGPLSQLKCARCCAVKVTTSNNESVQHSKEPQQLICLTFEDIWRKEDAMEVLECVVKEHGEIPNSAKAELYTLIGLDSQVSDYSRWKTIVSESLLIASTLQKSEAPCTVQVNFLTGT